MVTITSRPQIASEIGTTRLNAFVCPARYAAARTSRICSVAYAVDDRASEAKIARAVFLVSRSCAKRAVLIGLPTRRRFNEAIFYRRAANSLVNGGAKNATVCGLLKRRLWPNAHLRGACCFFIPDDQNTRLSVPYIMPLPLKVQRPRCVVEPSGKHSALEKNLALKRKAGGALPQAPP